jgi:hypothetical protein
MTGPSFPDAGPAHARGHAAVESLRTTSEGHDLANAIDRALAERRRLQIAAHETPLKERIR